MPITPARTTAGQQDGRQQGQHLHDVVGVLRRPAHVDVERAEQQVAQVLDRLERPIEPVGQARPRLPELLVELHLGPRQRGEGDAMRGERPADEADPAAQRDDLRQDVVPRPDARRARSSRPSISRSIAFDELEVVGEDLVGDGRQEAGRVERAERRLAFGRGIEPGERADRAVVDGDDPVPAGDDVDRRDGPAVRLVIGGRRAPSPSRIRWRWSAIRGQVRALRRVRQASRREPGSRPTAARPAQVARAAVRRRRSTAAGARRSRSGQPSVELDLAVLAVGVVEADVRAAGPRRGRRGMRDQWRIASRATTASARPRSRTGARPSRGRRAVRPADRPPCRGRPARVGR